MVNISTCFIALYWFQISPKASASISCLQDTCSGFLTPWNHLSFHRARRIYGAKTHFAELFPARQATWRANIQGVYLDALWTPCTEGSISIAGGPLILALTNTTAANGLSPLSSNAGQPLTQTGSRTSANLLQNAMLPAVRTLLAQRGITGKAHLPFSRELAAWSQYRSCKRRYSWRLIIHQICKFGHSSKASDHLVHSLRESFVAIILTSEDTWWSEASENFLERLSAKPASISKYMAFSLPDLWSLAPDCCAAVICLQFDCWPKRKNWYKAWST